MVYNGPSTGCLTCRRRKVRCSGERPTCHNCVKRKVECPGYGDLFDTRHRDQTQSIIKRAAYRSNELPTPPDSSSPTSVPSLSCAASSSANLSAPSIAVITPPHDGSGAASPFSFSIPLDLESTAITFFFNNFGRGIGDEEALHGFMPHLVPLYAASSVKSPLQAATASISINMLMLFANQASDGVQARSMYTKAVSSLKKAIANPDPASYNDMIVAILILDFYEELNSRFQKDAQKTDAHKMGALALIRHRNSWNYKDKLSKNITADVRAVMCNWALENGKDLPQDVVDMFSDPSLPQTKSAQLDSLTMQLVSIRTRCRTITAESRRWADDVDFGSWQRLLNDALQMSAKFQDWYNNIPSDWHPLHVTADEVEPAIKKAGLYGSRCAVYKDMAVCDILNCYRVRQITMLQIIQRCCLQLNDSTLQETQRSCRSAIQRLVDDILETLPYHVGDAVHDLQPTLSQVINYPYTYKNGAVFPDPSIQHPRQAMATGGWIIYTFLQLIYGLTRSSADIIPVTLRPGQVEWIRAQMRRVEHVYTFTSTDGSLDDSTTSMPESSTLFGNQASEHHVPEVPGVRNVAHFKQFWSFPMEWSSEDDFAKV